MGMFKQKLDEIVNDDEEAELFEVHDVVYFVGGGPAMVVMGINSDTKDNTIEWVTTGWFDEFAVFHREMFVIDHLTHDPEYSKNLV